MLSFLSQHEGLLPLWLLLVRALLWKPDSKANVHAGFGDLRGKYSPSLLDK